MNRTKPPGVAPALVRPRTWDELARFEPRLQALMQEAAEQPHNWRTYAFMKRRVSELVGYRSNVGSLTDSDLYEIAIKRLAEVLGL